MKKGTHISNLGLQIITFMLILLWVPVTVDKFWSLNEFHATLLNQPFPNWWADILYWLLPVLELFVVVFLIWPKSKFLHIGMLLSTILLIVFTSYIALGLLDTFEQRPCGCGSVLKSMTWEQHFWFNLFFLFLSGMGTYLTYHNEAITCRMVLLRAGRPKDTYRKLFNLKITTMVTFLKKFKSIAFTVFALSLATVLFSFKLFDAKSNVADELVWFHASPDGSIGSYIDTAAEPGGNCINPDANDPLCAVGMKEEDVPSGPTPVSPISNIDQDNTNLVQDTRHLKD